MPTGDPAAPSLARKQMAALRAPVDRSIFLVLASPGLCGDYFHSRPVGPTQASNARPNPTW